MIGDQSKSAWKFGVIGDVHNIRKQSNYLVYHALAINRVNNNIT